jgi:hypothetical protein
MELQKTIYNTLTGSTDVIQFTGDRIYHKHLPNNFKVNEINTVFIINSIDSEGSFDNSNEIEIKRLDIKLNYVTSSILFDYALIIKNLILNLVNSDENIKYIEFNNDDLVYNYDYQFYNLNLSFTIHYIN